MKKLNLLEKLMKEIDIYDDEIVNDYVASLNVKNNTKRMYIYQVKQFYKENGLDYSNLQVYKQVINMDKRGLSFQEVQLIKNYWENEEDYFLIFKILVESGMRISEFLSINWCAIKETQIKVETLKKGEEEYRYVFIQEDTLNLLKKNSIKLMNLNSNKVSYILSKMGKAINLPINLTPHICRHTKGTHLRQNGADIADIADILGHSSMDCTRLYYTKLNPHYLESISNLSNLNPVDAIDLVSLKRENESLKKKIYFLELKLSEYEK